MTSTFFLCKAKSAEWQWLGLFMWLDPSISNEKECANVLIVININFYHHPIETVLLPSPNRKHPFHKRAIKKIKIYHDPCPADCSTDRICNTSSDFKRYTKKDNTEEMLPSTSTATALFLLSTTTISHVHFSLDML